MDVKPWIASAVFAMNDGRDAALGFVQRLFSSLGIVSWYLRPVPTPACSLFYWIKGEKSI
jgi:hypothetical protein